MPRADAVAASLAAGRLARLAPLAEPRGAVAPSLRFRTVMITLGLSALAILVDRRLHRAQRRRTNLFESRRDQVLDDVAAARRAAAQRTPRRRRTPRDSACSCRTLDGAASQHDLERRRAAPIVAVFREPGQPPVTASRPQDFDAAPRLAEASSRDELREQVQDDPDQQCWQSVALPTPTAAPVPGIVVGQQLDGARRRRATSSTSPTTSPTPQQTLGFVQAHAGIVGDRAARCCIGAIAWFVVRSVIEPDPARPPTPARSSPPATSTCACPSAARTSSRRSAGSFNAHGRQHRRRRSRSSPTSRVVQQRFVSDVSHELRTPLTTIRLAGDVLYDQRDDFPPATARTAELLHTQTERFEPLLADLLEISRYDAGSVQLETRADEPRAPRRGRDRVDARSSPRSTAPRSGSSRRAGTRRPRSTRAASAASCATCSATRSSTARAGRSSSRSTATQTAVALGVRDYGLGMTRRGRGARLRPVLARRPLPHPHDRRHRPRARDLARGRRRARRRARRLVAARRGHRVPARRCPRTPDAAAVVSPLPLEPPMRAPPRRRRRERSAPSTTRHGRGGGARCVAGLAAASVALMALLLAGCAAIPSSGPVQQGDPVPADSPVDLDIVAEGPHRGRDPGGDPRRVPQRRAEPAEQLPGGTGVPHADVRRRVAARRRRARSTCSPIARSRWSTTRPCASTRRPLRPSGTTASTRSPSPARPSRSTTASSRSRGSGASRARRPGILIDQVELRAGVPRVHRSTSSTRRTATSCPTCAGTPGRDSAQTSIVQALLAGPAEWLAPGVVSGLPRGRRAGARRGARSPAASRACRSPVRRSTTCRPCSAWRRSWTRASSACGTSTRSTSR